MVTDDVLDLISVTTERDSAGIWRKTETLRRVFCRYDSITQTEFFEAGRNGLNPEFRFSVFGDDYQGEATVVFRDQRYAVYRTYRNGDYMELYVQREGGAVGGQENPN